MDKNIILLRAPLGPLGTNCYLVGDRELGQAFLIDPATADMVQGLEEHNLKLAGILLTHGHGDHIGGVEELLASYDVPVYIHEKDAPFLTDPSLNLSEFSGHTISVEPKDIRYVTDGDEITLGDRIRLQVLASPGHTPGGVVYYMAPLAFAGDSLFRGSIGRTDFPGSSYDDLIQSVSTKLFTLPEDTVVYPGHGSETTIAYEKQYNPFVRG